MNNQPTISSASFNIKVLPKRVHMLLEVLTVDKWFSAEDLLHNAGIRDRLKVARYIRENLLIMSESGLVRRETHKSGSQYQLSDLGQRLYQVQLINPGLYADMMHFLFYVLVEKQQYQGISLSSWSWVYQSTCCLLWQARPTVPAFSDQAAALHQRLSIEYPEYTKGVYPKSPNAVVLWLSELQPPFLHIQGKRRNTCGRIWCSPELFVLGIDRCYQRKHLPYGTPLLLADQVWNEISQLCLMEVEQLEEVLEVARSTFSFLEMHTGEWGRSLILEHAIDVLDIL